MGGDYGKVLRSFWTDPDIKRTLSPEQKELLLYYFTSPHGNLAGLYYSPFEYVAAETGLPMERVREWTMGDLARFVSYDERTEEILVHRGARHQVGDELKAGDKRIKALQKVLTETHSRALVGRFLMLYPDLPFDRDNTPPPAPIEAPSKPLPSPFEAKAVTVAVTEQSKETVAKATGDEAPNDDTTETARPVGTAPPETPDPESVWAASRGLIAGAVREHAWLHRAAPQFGAARGRKWDMQNELSIARELLKQYNPEELMGGIEHWRRIHHVPEGEQWSLAACYAEGQRWRIELAVEGWRSAQIDAIDLTEFLEARRAS